MRLLLLHVILCFMVNVAPVYAIGMVVPNVPSLHVLQRLSPHFENPVGIVSCFAWCILVKWMLFPRPVENVWPHSSQVQSFLSMVTVGVEEYITVSCGRRRLTSKSFRFLFLLYAIMGGCGYKFLHFWLECKIGCRLCIFCLRSGIIGLYVVLDVIP